MDEIWLPVLSKPGVMASSLGRVQLPYSVARGRVYETKPRIGVITRSTKDAKHSYLNIYSNTFGNMKVHRLVCEAFYGPPPFEGAVVIHKNEDAHDNRAENLKWGTQKENLNMPGFLTYCSGRTGDRNPYVIGRRRRA